MPEEVLRAMSEAAGSYVDILELHKKAGDYIAKLTRNEAAFVPNGAATGIMLATAACVAGDDMEKRQKLPFSDGMKNEIILSQAGRVAYDYAIKMGGGRYVPYGDENSGTIEQIEAAITPNTAAIFVFYFEHRMGNQPDLEAQIKIAKKHGIYLFVDAAAQLPRRENLWRFTQAGADLAIFSGGKGLRGPQASGLIVGRKDLMDRILTIASPNGGIGRPMKVGKEEIVGLMTAVKLYMEHDEEAELADYERQVKQVIEAFAGDGGVEVTRSFPSEAGQPMPRAQIKLSRDAFKIEAQKLAEQLRDGEPGVLVSGHGDIMEINPQTLLDGEMGIVIDRLKQVLNANRV
jgi:L-seryl-tRNA(Ser) seleniumtransferase